MAAKKVRIKIYFKARFEGQEVSGYLLLLGNRMRCPFSLEDIFI